MKSPNYEKNDSTETNEQGDEYSEKRLKQYLENNSKLRKIYEEQIVAEKSLSEIIAGKRRIKRDAQMREEYKDRKLCSGGKQTKQQPIPSLKVGNREPHSGDVFEGVPPLETPLEEPGPETGDVFDGVPLLELPLEEPTGGKQTTQQPILSLKVGNREPHSGPPLRSERQRTLAKERYRKRKESETKEHREQHNKKRRERYMAQKVAAKKNLSIHDTGQSRVYRNVDSICKSTVNYESMESMYTPEYLNSLKIGGIPNHEVELKIGAPIILLRNLAPNKGLCNGTRLIVTQLCARVIEGVIISGNHVGEKAFIPRICMRPTDTTLPFAFKRVQFPVSLCYAMTINKSQGQTLKFVGLYLPNPIFSHGQFYVAISRVTTPLGLYIVCENETHPIVGMTKNVVYHEVFSNL